MTRLLALAVTLLLGTTAAAQETPWDKVTTLACTFPVRSVNDWREDLPHPHVKSEQEEFSFGLEGINLAKGTAQMVGVGGSAGVVVVPAAESLHFMESMASGNMNLTTVFNARTRDGRFKAVHSRHMKIIDPLPSQAYGFCRIK